MVENKCSKCGVDVEYTVFIQTDKQDIGFPNNPHQNECENWCFDCLRAKILWPKPNTSTINRQQPAASQQSIIDPPNTNRPKQHGSIDSGLFTSTDPKKK